MKILLLFAATLLVAYPTPHQEEETNTLLVAKYKSQNPSLDIVPARRTKANHDDHSGKPLWYCPDAARTLKTAMGAHYCEKVK